MRWRFFWVTVLAAFAINSCVQATTTQAQPLSTPSEITSEGLVGYQVVSREGTAIGSVDGVVIDVESGEIEYVVVLIKDIYNFGKGATHGPQDHYLALPWSRLVVDAANRQVTVDAEASMVEDAPFFTEVPDTSIEGWDREVARYWEE
jgi:sporulation protein YlmC with PRC-barrel domain